MRTSAQWWARGGPLLRSGILLLLVPLALLALQLLVVGPRLPRATRLGVEEQEGAVAFSVMSIEPERSSRQRGSPSRLPGLGEEEEEGQQEEMEVEDEGRSKHARAYEDENEMHSSQFALSSVSYYRHDETGEGGQGVSAALTPDQREMGPRTLEVRPWAAAKPSFTTELSRIVTYISAPQLNCSRVLSPGQAQSSQPPADSPRWLLCAEDWLLPAAHRPCVAYSFSMDKGDAEFLKTMLLLGCEVHSFDPSNSNASGSHLGNSLASNHGDGGLVRQHKMWLEWRAPRKRKHKTRGSLGSVSQTLADIMAALGHRTVHFLYADLLSAEWRVFQNWIESGTLQNVHHLVATVHLQWPGFEVGGTNEEVLRYWFSVLQGLQASGLKLIHSSAGEGHSVLKQSVANAHSSYTLCWVNTRH